MTYRPTKPLKPGDEGQNNADLRFPGDHKVTAIDCHAKRPQGYEDIVDRFHDVLGQRKILAQAEDLADQRGLTERGGTKWLLLDALKRGPMTGAQLARVIMQGKPDLTYRQAYNRAYQALLRLEDRGLVCRNGVLWLAQ